MRITMYNTMMDDDRKTVLVKERAVNCTEVSSLSSPSAVRTMLNSVFHADRLAEEHLWVIALDTKCHPVGVFDTSHGSADTAMVSIREIFVRLCLCGATRFVLAHNHPSGDTEPSKEDTAATERVLKASELMGIPLLDHIIIGNYNSYSMREAGLIS